MFEPSDIRWVKNVKRNKGSDWAYFDDGMENWFDLNFSSSQTAGARYIRPGEIILLFQRVDKISGIEKRTYLTHLVTPLDHNLRHDPSLHNGFEWYRKVAVVARAAPRTAIYTSTNNLNFYKPQRGKICKVDLLKEGADKVAIQRQIWSLFSGKFNESLEQFLQDVEVPDELLTDDIIANEGAEHRILKEHLGRERNKLIIGIAKNRALEAGGGNIICECCDFNFRAAYGDHVYGFIECHHATPISRGERITSLNDLHMVCSNCHRMLHRKRSNDSYYTVKELRCYLKNKHH